MIKRKYKNLSRNCPVEKVFNVFFFISLMGDYKVYRSQAFQEAVSKYGKSFQDRIDKIESKLMFNPNYGNPLGTK